MPDRSEASSSMPGPVEKIGRRDFVLRMHGFVAAGSGMRSRQAAESDQERRIARIVREYESQGWHRTGTRVDRASAEWLARKIAEAGGEPVHLEPFALSSVHPVEAYIEIGGRRVEGLPLFDASFTGPSGVSGRLGGPGSHGVIGVFEVPPAGHAASFENARASGHHAAIIAVTTGARPGLAPRNADKFSQPFGPPVLQVSSTERNWLAQQAAEALEARVVVTAKYSTVQALNVIAQIRGRNAR